MIDDRDNIEAKLVSSVLVFVKPRRCQAANLSLFVRADRLGRATEASCAAGLDLDEGNRAPFRDHQIELTSTTAPVAIEHYPSALFVPTGGEFFALSP